MQRICELLKNIQKLVDNNITGCYNGQCNKL